MVPGFEDIVDAHRPAGYRLLRRQLRKNDGLATYQATINVAPHLEGREALFVALHEFGHVHNRHLRNFPGYRVLPAWQYEFEADQYAIQAMRKAGIPVPRERLAWQKEIVRDLIAQDDGSEHVPEEILRYAFGREWRKHK